jgi:hypothetical protein
MFPFHPPIEPLNQPWIRLEFMSVMNIPLFMTANLSSAADQLNESKEYEPIVLA